MGGRVLLYHIFFRGILVTIGFNVHCYMGTSLRRYMLENNNLDVWCQSIKNKLTISPSQNGCWGLTGYNYDYTYIIQTQKSWSIWNIETGWNMVVANQCPTSLGKNASKPEEFSSILLSSGSFFLGTLLGCWAWRGFSSGVLLSGWGQWLRVKSLGGLKVCQKCYGWDWASRSIRVGVFSVMHSYYLYDISI